jgi:hypothetical protein
MPEPTGIQMLQLVVLSLFFWLAIKVLLGMVFIRFLWGPG